MLSNSIERAKTALGVKSDYELAQKLNITPSSVGGYRKRGNVLPLEQCIKIANQTSVSLDWLILGKGDQKGGGTAAASLPAHAGTGDGMPAVGFVPLYDITVSAGHGALFDYEHIIQWVPFDSRWLAAENLNAADCVCFSVGGDSMMPGLADSDIVLVNRTRQRGDGVFIIRIGEVLRVKRLQWLADGTLRISSDNPLYQPEVLNPADYDETQFAIIGACHSRIGRVF